MFQGQGPSRLLVPPSSRAPRPLGSSDLSCRRVQGMGLCLGGFEVGPKSSTRHIHHISRPKLHTRLQGNLWFRNRACYRHFQMRLHLSGQIPVHSLAQTCPHLRAPLGPPCFSRQHCTCALQSVSSQRRSGGDIPACSCRLRRCSRLPGLLMESGNSR